MKNALVLHGTSSSSQGNWFPWLKNQLEIKGYHVWAPDLPNAEQPNEKTYNDFLLAGNFDFNDALIIGHSSGAVAALKLLQNLAEGVVAYKAILVGAFNEQLAEQPKWTRLKDMFLDKFDFAAIKNHCREFVFLHSTDDPHCPIEQAEDIHHHLGGHFVRFTDKQHFSTDTNPQFTKLPEILDCM